MPTRPLPNDPSLEHLKKEAKRLLKAADTGDPDALAQIAEHHPRASRSAEPFSLADAQLVVARSYGFGSWTRLKQYLKTLEQYAWNPPARDQRGSLVDVFIGLACLDYGAWHRSNPDKARRLLEDHPELAHADIFCATAVGNVDAVRAMIERDPALVNTRGGSLKWEPILYACYSRMPDMPPSFSTLDVARLLLAKGADPNAGFLWDGTYLFTALTGAFGEGEDGPNNPPHPHRDALATLLLDAGADPNDGQTLYNRHFRASDDHFQLLFSYGLGTDRGGPWFTRLGDRAVSPSRMLVEELWSAAKNNRPARVALLTEHGVDLNTPGLRDGRTPYEVAVREGNKAIADYLVAHGARPVELDVKERFALACIQGSRTGAMALLAEQPDLLEQLGHRGRVDLIHRAARSHGPSCLRLTVELGIDINGVVPNSGLDRTVLHDAAMFGSLEGVQLLIELGADPHLRDPTYHSTAIGWAYHGGQHHVVEYLARFASIFDALRCNAVDRVASLLAADPSLANAVDEHGTPLVFYLHSQLTRLDDLLTLLRSHGCDINARHPKGGTLLDTALAEGLMDFADILRRHGMRTSDELAGS